MTRYLRFVVASAAVLLGPAVLPGVAAAAPDTPDSVRLESVGQRSIESGRMYGLDFRPGGITRGPMGVHNRNGSAVDGLVAQLTLPSDDFRFARRYDNCWYALEGKPGSAWCEFDAKIPDRATLQLAGPVVKATDDADPAVDEAVVVRWVSRAWAEAAGGIEALADEDATEGTTAVRGAEGTLTLEPGSPWLSTFMGASTMFPVHVAVTEGPSGAPDILPPSNPDSADLAAVQERTTAGERPTVRDGERGKVVPGVIGVRNEGDAAVDGLVVELRLADEDMIFARKYDNCWYALRGKPGSAWCEFDRALAPGATLKLGSGVAIATQQRLGDITKDIRFHWVSAGWAEGHGGIRALAGMSATPGTGVVRGTEGTLTLETAPANLKPGLTGPVDYILFTVPPVADQPTTTPPATPPATPGTGDGAGGGGLPVTGTQTAAIAGLGGGLLAAGLIGYAIARRRRTHFVA
ncbi:LPXTG cell wall anchor domain-containing protein [Couchioplanes caeruleus]|uniref:LPXTG cell wall anchor domain-containing protein n=1 Tax=Couchioplanes caeruleus TaxID=56438 RepID=UPI00201C889A|nr:LPXTG cell wall anchor domain-containing protein [Couchioplanes caeruleus]UQU63758.1 LPXTG cell wall anchor domain-containing protein [Couchioplanes caeruleus]